MHGVSFSPRRGAAGQPSKEHRSHRVAPMALTSQAGSRRRRAAQPVRPLCQSHGIESLLSPPPARSVRHYRRRTLLAAGAPRRLRHPRSAAVAAPAPGSSKSQYGRGLVDAVGFVALVLAPRAHRHPRCRPRCRHPKSFRQSAASAGGESFEVPGWGAPISRRTTCQLACHYTGSNSQPRRRTRPSSSRSRSACWSSGKGKALSSRRTSELQLPRRPMI
jgi:hypothetical protein